MLQLLAKTLMELATVAGTTARRRSRHLRDFAPPSMRHAAAMVAAELAASVSARTGTTQPAYRDAAGDTLQEGAATILVVDVDHATTITQHDADRRTRLVGDVSVCEQVAAHGGVEVDAAGARFAAAFSSVRCALLCAIGLQRTLAGRAAEQPEEPMRARIALHTEAVVPEGADRFGSMGIVAARIASHARGGEILVSSEVRALAGRDLPFGPERTIRIEWPGGSCAVYEVYWAGEVAAAETARGMFRREGESWSIAWRGRRCLVRDVRGLHYIAQLLRHPGREFHALDLVAVNGSGPAGAQRGYGVPALDAQARTVYRRRLDDLRDDLEEAEALCDLGRAARARGEQEALTDELAAAVGLDGRDRSAAAAAERARSTVAQGIRVALKRVGTGLPALADELRLRVKTGIYCVYVPDPSHPTDWAL